MSGTPGEVSFNSVCDNGAVEAPVHDLFVKAAELRQESVLGMVVEHGGDELANRGVVFRIGIDPTRVDLRLAGGLFHVRRPCDRPTRGGPCRPAGASGQTPTRLW